MKNKRANIPITILVIGVFVICSLAVLSFIISDNKLIDKQNLFGVNTLKKVSADTEKFYFYRDVGFSDEQAAEKIGAVISEDSGKILTISRQDKRIEVIYKKRLG